MPSKKAMKAYNALLSRYTESTRICYKYNLDNFYEWCETEGIDPIKNIDRRKIERYAEYLTTVRHNKPTTVGQKIRGLRNFYSLAIDDDLLPKNPTAKVMLPRVFKNSEFPYLTRFEMGAVLNKARLRSYNHAALIVLLGYLGLRKAEAIGTNIEDVKMEGEYTVLSIIGKGGRPARIPMPAMVARVVYAAIGERTEGPILLGRDGERMSKETADRAVRSLVKAAGIEKNITPHSLRRSYITAGFDAGLSLRTVQYGARHADPKTTMLYDQGRQNMDAHANHTIAAFMASAV